MNRSSKRLVVVATYVVGCLLVQSSLAALPGVGDGNIVKLWKIRHLLPEGYMCIRNLRSK